MDGTECKPSNRKLLEEFIYEHEPWLLIVPSRDPVHVTQYLEQHSVSSNQRMKKLMPLREGLHVKLQRYMQQYFGDGYWQHEHPGGHASWREPTMRKFTESSTYFVKGPVCRSNVQKIRAESSEYVDENNGFLHKQLENQNILGEKSMHRKFGRETG